MYDDVISTFMMPLTSGHIVVSSEGERDLDNQTFIKVLQHDLTFNSLSMKKSSTTLGLHGTNIPANVTIALPR